MMIIENPVIAVLLARLILGVLFFFQGFDKIFRIGILNVSEEFSLQLKMLKLPKMFFSSMAYITSYIEFICGAMLILGLFVDVTLWILSLNLFLVSLAFSIINPIWDMKIYMPRLILILFLLSVPHQWFAFGLDQIF